MARPGFPLPSTTQYPRSSLPQWPGAAASWALAPLAAGSSGWGPTLQGHPVKLPGLHRG